MELSNRIYSGLATARPNTDNRQSERGPRLLITWSNFNCVTMAEVDPDTVHNYPTVQLEENFHSLVLPQAQAEPDERVVQARNVKKSFGKGKPVLNGLCMNVKKGSIYGLLGSSGCGKTTLLSCVVGLSNWDSGDIFLFNEKVSDTPGRRVGYMPQDVALFNQISVREVVNYFGRLYGMSSDDVQRQWEWLVKFLQLPTTFRVIRDLSGGQKRRVSLAVALLNSPELLILDEPTVGLDPLLRESIWDYLVKLVETRKTTVIITTHYIEETRLSHTIGVMRNGRLLTEESPQVLLYQYGCDLLEQVVLNLCHDDKDRNRQIANSTCSTTVQLQNSQTQRTHHHNHSRFSQQREASELLKNIQVRSHKFPESPTQISQALGKGSTCFDRVWAMSMVIWLFFWRYPLFMAVVIVLPTLQMLLTVAVVGSTPKDLKFGFVNLDQPPYDYCFNKDYISQIENETSTCNFKSLGCSIILELGKTETFQLRPIKSNEEALQQVKAGTIRGYFSLTTNFSQHFESFALERKYAENETLVGSRVHLHLDMSESLGTVASILDSFRAYERFLGKLAKKCGWDPREVQLPLLYRDPVYGTNEPTYHSANLPISISITIMEFVMLLPSLLLILDRKQGTLDRSRVAGLCFKEVIFSHFITEAAVIICQTLVAYYTFWFVYNLNVKGPLWLFFFLCLLVGMMAVSLGLFIGILCSEEVEAFIVGILICSHMVVLSGGMWPVEMMRRGWRDFAAAMPTTAVSKALAATINKGEGFTHPDVWPQVLIVLGWMTFFVFLSVLTFMKQKQ